MSVPDWWETLLLALAAYRIWRLLAFDDILDRPRRAVLYLGREWQKEGDPVPAKYRGHWAQFLICPWCLGFWVALAWWGAWQIWPHATLIVAVPFAVSAGVGMLGQFVASE